MTFKDIEKKKAQEAGDEIRLESLKEHLESQISQNTEEVRSYEAKRRTTNIPPHRFTTEKYSYGILKGEVIEGDVSATVGYSEAGEGWYEDEKTIRVTFYDVLARDDEYIGKSSGTNFLGGIILTGPDTNHKGEIKYSLETSIPNSKSHISRRHPNKILKGKDVDTFLKEMGISTFETDLESSSGKTKYEIRE